MHDEYQIHIPPSFTAIYSDARQRLMVPMSQLRDRYEVCEDLANHLTEHCKSIHVEIGVDELEVLVRCHRGLCSLESGVTVPEATWVVTRLAELLYWPLPSWEADGPDDLAQSAPEPR